MKTKDVVLKLLEENSGEFVSGAQIAESLSISRNAIWKTINRLKAEGHVIDGRNNKGYMLITDPNKLTSNFIYRHLTTDAFGQKIYIFGELDSTNEKAKTLISNGESTGTVVIADTQTSGKGRRGRIFYSPENTGIYMSIIVKADDNKSDLIKLTTMAALAICLAIEKLTDLSPKIKWVNDVFLNGKKIAGILTEATTNLEDGTIDAAIVGIGINFNTKDFPTEITDVASSLNLSTMTRNDLIAEVLNQLEVIYNKEQSSPHIAEYKKRLIILNRDIKVMDPLGSYDARAIDLDDTGALIVQLPTGEIKALNSGEISIKGDYND